MQQGAAIKLKLVIKWENGRRPNGIGCKLQQNAN